jgi:hypothetical protein
MEAAELNKNEKVTKKMETNCKLSEKMSDKNSNNISNITWN